MTTGAFDRRGPDRLAGLFDAYMAAGASREQAGVLLMIKPVHHQRSAAGHQRDYTREQDSARHPHGDLRGMRPGGSGRVVALELM